MSTLSLRKIKHDSSAVDNITLDSAGRVGVGSQDLSAFGRKFLVDGTGGFNNSSGAVGVGFSRGAANTYGYIGTGDWAVNGLSNADFGISSGATGALVLGTGAGVERVRIDNSGRVTMPYQPRFSAGTTSSNTVATSTVLAFDNTSINVGGHYNTSTYRFTAPIAGTYFFIAQPALLSPSNSRIALRKNGTVVFYHEQAPVSGWQTLTFSIMINLAVNDYVDLYNATGASFQLDYNQIYSSFSGWLMA